MSVEFKNSETKNNLMRAFAGESQARNRYTIAASEARKQNLYVIEAVFQFTADQEKEHAEVFYQLLQESAGETIHIDGDYPVDIIGIFRTVAAAECRTGEFDGNPEFQRPVFLKIG